MCLKVYPETPASYTPTAFKTEEKEEFDGHVVQKKPTPDKIRHLRSKFLKKMGHALEDWDHHKSWGSDSFLWRCCHYLLGTEVLALGAVLVGAPFFTPLLFPVGIVSVFCGVVLIVASMCFYKAFHSPSEMKKSKSDFMDALKDYAQSFTKNEGGERTKLQTMQVQFFPDDTLTTYDLTGKEIRNKKGKKLNPFEKAVMLFEKERESFLWRTFAEYVFCLGLEHNELYSENIEDVKDALSCSENIELKTCYFRVSEDKKTLHIFELYDSTKRVMSKDGLEWKWYLPVDPVELVLFKEKKHWDFTKCKSLDDYHFSKRMSCFLEDVLEIPSLWQREDFRAKDLEQPRNPQRFRIY